MGAAQRDLPAREVVHGDAAHPPLRDRRSCQVIRFVRSEQLNAIDVTLAPNWQLHSAMPRPTRVLLEADGQHFMVGVT